MNVFRREGGGGRSWGGGEAKWTRDWWKLSNNNINDQKYKTTIFTVTRQYIIIM